MERNPAELKKGYFLEGTNGYLVICIHGFCGTQAEHYLTALALHEAGYSVSVPLLRDHGTSIEEMDHAHYQDWTASVEEEYAKRKAAYRGVYLCGLSMGGLLALYLAEHHPEILAISVMAPALIYKDKVNYLAPLILPFKKHLPFTTSFPQISEENLLLLKEGYGASSVHGAVEMSKLQKLVKRNLVSIGQPLIIFQSKADTLVDPKTEDYVLKHISSSEKKGFLYEKSSHVMSLDVDREAIFKETLAFFAAHQPALL